MLQGRWSCDNARLLPPHDGAATLDGHGDDMLPRQDGAATDAASLDGCNDGVLPRHAGAASRCCDRAAVLRAGVVTVDML